MKTAQEWEQEFDILYNNINSNTAPALDTYEKSVFLTMAQEQVVKTLYSGGALGQDSFETTELLRRSLDSLIREVEFTDTDSEAQSLLGGDIFDLSNLKDKVLYITYEQLINTNTEDCANGSILNVVPTTQDVYFKTKHNPFRGANLRRALRLDYGDDKVEIITTLEKYKYIVRYLKKPYPIILESLTGTTDYIDGEQLMGNPICELDESLHRTILNAAVALAAAASQQ